MIARLFALLVLAFAIPVASAPVDWTKTAVRTPQGGIRVGNPRARVSFVEIANYTCPHCAHFSQAGSETLARHIRSGALAVEFRPIAYDPLGLAAAVVARCAVSGAGPGPFLAVNDALYGRQSAWYPQAAAYAQDNDGELVRYTELVRLQQIAQNGGIAPLAVAAGLSPQRIAACFADRRQLDDTLRAVQAAGVITNSTPTFLFGREKLTAAKWPDIAARLSAAGLK